MEEWVNEYRLWVVSGQMTEKIAPRDNLSHEGYRKTSVDESPVTTELS